MSADVASTLSAKYDLNIEKEVREFLTGVTGETIGDFHEDMKSGEFLCRLINKIRPESVRGISASKMPFKMMENTGKYLTAVEKLGMPPIDLFQTVDLFEKKNMTSVLNHLYSLGRFVHKVPGYSGPVIVAKEVKIDPEKVFGMPTN